MTGQPSSPITPKLAGTWRKITAAACANKYPETISFFESTYLAARGKDQAFICWDAGIYRLENEVTLVLGTATDELVTYKVKLSTGRIDVSDPDGCYFSYQYEGPTTDRPIRQRR